MFKLLINLEEAEIMSGREKYEKIDLVLENWTPQFMQLIPYFQILQVSYN